MDRIDKLKDLIPKLKANKKIQPLKIECLEWELKYLEGEKKQLSIYDVVSSFLDKEAISLNIKKEYLYLNLWDNELSLMAENTNDYYFSLRVEKIIDK